MYLADLKVQDQIITIKTINTNNKTIPAIIVLANTALLKGHIANNLKNDTLIGITITGYL